MIARLKYTKERQVTILIYEEKDYLPSWRAQPQIKNSHVFNMHALITHKIVRSIRMRSAILLKSPSFARPTFIV